MTALLCENCVKNLDTITTPTVNAWQRDDTEDYLKSYEPILFGRFWPSLLNIFKGELNYGSCVVYMVWFYLDVD